MFARRQHVLRGAGRLLRPSAQVYVVKLFDRDAITAATCLVPPVASVAFYIRQSK
jgi:hypothetical protein